MSKGKLGSPVTSQGIIVKGEAPESDEEEELHSAGSGTCTSSATKEGKPTVDKIQTRRDEIEYKTLLHKKLRERNISLHKNTYDFVRQTIGAAGRELNTTNQQLLRSQVQLQEAVSALLILHNNTLQLNTKLVDVTSTSFLPDISIPLSVVDK